MEARIAAPGGDDVKTRLAAILQQQRKAQLLSGPPPAETRIDRMDRLLALIRGNAKSLADAVADDYGHRSREETMIADVAASVESLEHARRHLRGWMKDKRRGVRFPLGILGARAWIRFQPKGVIGVISPWNFPVNLAVSPLAGVLAAGNRAMLKPSEFTPATSALLARLFRETFDETEVAVVTGGVEVGTAFSRLPFDHLVFTGATGVARKVMSAAAESLVPLTLELGGKSPVIVSRSADLNDAALKVMAGKLFNAGQVCLAPDYALVPAEQLESFAAKCQEAAAQLYPRLQDNPDYSAIIHDGHAKRLQEYVGDALSMGARVIEINPGREDFGDPSNRKFPPALILGSTDAMKIMQEEIFGPLLPLRPYQRIEEAIAEVNGRARPLALYYFGRDAVEEEQVLNMTVSGGVTLNDILLHATVEDLPFGGIGPSGMGRYHGVHGFREFSHAKAVYRQSRAKAVVEFFRPPYGERTRKRIATLARLR